MQAFFFGTGERRLYGCFHAAARRAEPPLAVLLCQPFGQESVRAHRMFRVLAERLSRRGADVLRFDPFGAGDSAGPDEALDLEGWTQDLLTAHAELRHRSPGAPVWWLGARLGATVACLAQRQAVRGPAGLLLCEPVLDGSAYRRELAHATVHALEASHSIKDPAWRAALAQDPGPLEREAIGFAMGESMHAQLGQLRAQDLDLVAAPGTRVRVVSSIDSPSLSARVQRWVAMGTTARLDLMHFDFDWTSEEALNTALVPNDMIQHLMRILEGTA